MKSLYSAFALAFMLAHTTAFSQDYVDLLSAGAISSPGNTETVSGRKVDITETFVNVKLPVVRSNKDVFLTGVNWNSISFHGHFDPVHSDIYYGTTLLLGYTKHWSDKFQTLLLALPRIASDFEEVSGKDLQLGGILLFTFKKHDRLKYKLGAYYNEEFFGPLVIPIIGLDWQASDKLRVFGNMPINLTVERKLNDRFSTGFFFQAINTSYRLGETYNNRYLHKVSQDLSLYLDTYITPNVVFNVKAGYSVGRSFGIYDDGDKHALRSMLFAVGGRNNPFNNPIKDGLLLEGKLSFRVFAKK